jgi:hypothetical protein
MIQSADNETAIIQLDYGFMKTFGENALVGRLVKKYKDIPKNICLEFYEPSLIWFHKNNLLRLSLVPNDVPYYLVNDILYLISCGCNITTKTVIKDPPDEIG